MSQKIKTSVEIDGSLTANSIVKSGGNSSQILAANGSVITAGSGVTISGGIISASGSAGVTSFNTRNGAVTLISSDVTTALGYTPYNASNPAGYISSYTETDTLASVTGRGASTSSNVTFSGITRLGGSGYKTYIEGGLMFRDYGNNTLTNGRFYYQDDAWHFRGGGEGEADVTSDTSMYIRSGNIERLVLHDGNISSYAVPSSRTITINGTTQDLSANRSFTVTANETDTLATVTSRGAVTTSDIFTPNNGGIFFNGNAAYGSGVYGRNFGQNLAFNAGGVQMMNLTSDGNLEFNGVATGLAGAYILNNNTNLKIHSTQGGGTTKDLVLQSGGSAGAPQLTLKANGNVIASVDMRAPIFYDTNNTGYYLDPASTSNLNAVNLSTLYSNRSGATGNVINIDNAGSSTWPFIFQTSAVGNDNASGFWTSSLGYPDMRLRKDDGTVRALISSWERSYTTYGLSDDTDMRSPIFYDSNNTGYYVDPASTTKLNALTLSSLASDDGMIENNTGSYFHLGGWGVGRTAATAVLVNTAYRSDISDSAPWSGVTSKPENIMYYSGFTLDANTMPTNSTGFTYSVNAPYTGPIARFSTNGGYDLWLNSPYGGNGYGLAFRTRNGDAGSFNSWQFPAVYNVNSNGGGSLYSTIYYDSNDTSYYSDPGSNSRLYKLSVHRGIAGGGQNIFTGLEGVETANGRGQIVISSSYSDMVIASSQDNNQHGSTLTFAAYNPSNSNQYRKFVINQGNWGSRKHMLSFGYSDAEQTNPHSAINSGVNSLTIDGLGRNIGIRSENPGYPLDVNGIINTPSGYISVSNPWGTSNSAFFPNGITTAGGTNWIYGYTFIGNAPANGAGHEFFSSGSSYSTGNMEAGSSMRAPIFYDRNDTGFYLDPNSTTNSLVVAGAIKHSGTLSRPSVQWGQSGNVTGAVVIKLPGTSPGNYGMIHAVIDVYEYNSNNVCTITIGGHNWSTQWYNYGAQLSGNTNKPVRLAVKDGKYCIVLGNSSTVWEYGQVVLRKIQNGTYYNGTMDLGGAYSIGIESDSYSWVSEDLRKLTSSGYILSSSAMYSPVYYDNNNSGYYVDPASTSNFNAANFAGSVNLFGGYGPGSGPGLGFENQNSFIRLAFWGMDFYDWNHGIQLVIDNGYVSANNSFRAPIFYDSNNTGYYGDFSSTGTSLNIAGSLNAATFNKPAILVNSSGTGSAGSSIGMQQVTAEGWTGIFVDFEPNTGWGLYHDNPNNYFCITAENTTGSLRSFTVPSRQSGDRTAYEKIRFDQGNGSILAGGDITAFSDARVKDNVKVIDNAIDRIKAIRGVTFTKTNSEGKDKDKRHAGVLAQEVLEVLPEVVNKDESTGMYSVAYGNLAGLFIEAIKEQQTQIEELKELVNKLINKK